MLRIELGGTKFKNEVVVTGYFVSPPFNQVKKLHDKKIYFTISNVKNTHVKGDFYVYYSKKIDLNDNDFIQNTDLKVKCGKIGWLTNTSKVKNHQSFKPVANDFKATHLKDSELDTIDFSKDTLKIEQFILLSKKFLVFIPKIDNYSTTVKELFPFELLKNLEEIKDNYQFFFEYADLKNGDFQTESVRIDFSLYDNY